MKFLIDECLSPDHVVTRRAVDDGYVLVTHNTAVFRGLYGREDLHVGLVASNTAPGLMSLDLQMRLFRLALSDLVARRHGTKYWRSGWTRTGP